MQESGYEMRGWEKTRKDKTRQLKTRQQYKRQQQQPQIIEIKATKSDRPEEVLTCHGVWLLVRPQSICCLTRVLSLSQISQRRSSSSSRSFLNFSIWSNPGDVWGRISFCSTEKRLVIKNAGNQEHCRSNWNETHQQDISNYKQTPIREQTKKDLQWTLITKSFTSSPKWFDAMHWYVPFCSLLMLVIV